MKRKFVIFQKTDNLTFCRSSSQNRDKGIEKFLANYTLYLELIFCDEDTVNLNWIF